VLPRGNTRPRIEVPFYLRVKAPLFDYPRMQQSTRGSAEAYAWLESGQHPGLSAWDQEQDRRTHEYFSANPHRSEIHRRLSELFSLDEVSVPVARQAGASIRLFYLVRRDDQQHPTLMMRDGESSARPILDPKTWDPDGRTIIDWWSASPDGQLVAVGLSRDGTEDSTLYLLRASDAVCIGEPIEHTPHASVGWGADGTRIYYTRHRKNSAGAPVRCLYSGLVASQPDTHECLYEGQPGEWPSIVVGPRGDILVLRVQHGWHRNDLFVRRVAETVWRPLVVGKTGTFEVVPTADRLFVRSDENAARFAVRSLSVDQAWSESVLTIPERNETLCALRAWQGGLIGLYLEDASAKLVLWRPGLEHTAGEEVPLPSRGSIDEISADGASPAAFYSFQSFALPKTVYALPLAGGAPVEHHRPVCPRLPDVEIQRVRAASSDGTLVPMFIVRSRTCPPGPRPTILVGYGAFNVPMLPKFEPASLSFIERGGVLALANFRGGGEFGAAWYEAGRGAAKERVIEDAVACAEFLIERGVTDGGGLAFVGESHSGLVAGALAPRRPELFQAIIAAVPLTDMLRYHVLRGGALLLPEYGSPEEPLDREALERYSPLHHVASGVAYPSVLLTCSDTDSRVDPAHARKMAAALQDATSSTRPVLLRIERGGGHGLGKGRAERIGEMSDLYAFLASELRFDAPS
jgi:prolyl oligopeptidase